MKNDIWSPYKLNSEMTLKNRVVMAPLTRAFADDQLAPTKQVSDYYAKRSDAGLIISEATIVSPMAQGYPRTPGIFLESQIEAWKGVTDAVHRLEGKIFLQLWHVGRVSHSYYLNGKRPFAPSAVALTGRLRRSDHDNLYYETPKEMSLHEIKRTITEFGNAARNALLAGFDGVEIHGANGYLIDQFLHQHTNLREDDYGGSLENRLLFAKEIIKEVLKEIPAQRVGFRISPGAHLNMTHTAGDEETFIELLKFIELEKLAYVHLGIFDDHLEFDYLNGRASKFIRKNFSGTFINCGSISFEEALADIESHQFELIAFGRDFIANPNLIEKLKCNKALTKYDPKMLSTLV